MSKTSALKTSTNISWPTLTLVKRLEGTPDNNTTDTSCIFQLEAHICAYTHFFGSKAHISTHIQRMQEDMHTKTGGVW